MVDTVTVTEERRAMQFENSLNKAFRHCRIGKVKPKNTGNFGPFGLPVVMPMATPWQEMPKMCQGCFGKACGNVACPLRLQATCGRVEALDPTSKITPLYQA